MVLTKGNRYNGVRGQDEGRWSIKRVRKGAEAEK